MFDRLFDWAKFHTHAAVYMACSWSMETILVSICLEHGKMIEETLRKLTEKRDRLCWRHGERLEERQGNPLGMGIQLCGRPPEGSAPSGINLKTSATTVPRVNTGTRFIITQLLCPSFSGMDSLLRRSEVVFEDLLTFPPLREV